MASTTESTFGSKIYNAEQLLETLKTITGYSPTKPENSVAALDTLIQDIQTNNSVVANHQSNFSLAVNDRQNQFQKNPTSLNKTLSPINSYVKAQFGKTSKEAKDIAAIVVKIRGEKTDKLKKDAEGEFVSQSERSYGSQLKNYTDINDTLISYGPTYTPSNPLIRTITLTQQITDLRTSNLLVTSTYVSLKTAKDLRDTQYQDLNKRTQTIKDTVKAQYGVSSTEYSLIKKYKI